MHKILLFGLIAFLVPAYASTAQPNQKPNLLIIDYDLGGEFPLWNLDSSFRDIEFEVFDRRYYPALVKNDVTRFDVILLIGGGDPGMSIDEVELAIDFVSRGKVLILAAPSNGPHGFRRKVNPGVHDRYQFNEILNRLNINLYVYHDGHEISPILNPIILFEPANSLQSGLNLRGTVASRAGTRIFVGDGAVPLLMDLDGLAVTEDSINASEADPNFNKVLRTVLIQPSDTLPGEAINLILHKQESLTLQLYNANMGYLESVELYTDRIRGRVEGVSEAKNTFTIRMSGNTWNSSYALVDIPVTIVATAFVRRGIINDTQFSHNLALKQSDEVSSWGTAVAAVGRTNRLGKGFVVVVDRDLLLGSDHGIFPPLGIDNGAVSTHRILKDDNKQLRDSLAGYVGSLIRNPDSWISEHGYSVSQIPGNPKPALPLNNISVLPELPERVLEVQIGTVIITYPASGSQSQSDTTSSSASLSESITNAGRSGFALPMPEGEDVTIQSVEKYHRNRRVGTSNNDSLVNPPLRGVWEPVARLDNRVAELVRELPDLGLEFIWTVAPAASYTGDDSIRAGADFETWAQGISSGFTDSSIAWYIGTSAPDLDSAEFEDALDPRGDPIGLPSRFDMTYVNRYLIEPSRVIARYSRNQSNIKGIVHDWEPHLDRIFEPYASTDAFDDSLFREFVRHLERSGLYNGVESESLMRLERDRRFEWLLKSGYLEAYYQLLEFNAELLGLLYRKAMDEINPRLIHGAFIRTLRPTWFHLGFWRGVGTPERPFLVFSYEQLHSNYSTSEFFRHKAISGQVFKVGLLGLLKGGFVESQLRSAVYEGGNLPIYTTGYALERGLWLIEDPPADAGLDAPASGVNREILLNAIRRANQN